MSRDTFDMFSPRDRGRFGENESIRGNDSVRSDLIDLAMALHVETPAKNGHEGAVLVSDDGDEAKAVWLPKSRCQVEHTNKLITGKRKNGTSVGCKSVTVTLSRSFAQEKGLI